MVKGTAGSDFFNIVIHDDDPVLFQTIDAGGGADRLSVSYYDAIFNPGIYYGGVSLYGGGGDDIISTAYVGGYASGGAGNDLINMNFAPADIDGGPGNDNLAFSDDRYPYEGPAYNGTIRGGAGSDHIDTVTYHGEATVWGDEGNDTITALASAPGDDDVSLMIDAGSGDDDLNVFGVDYGARIDLGVGSDYILLSGSGQATVNGGPGNDTIVFGYVAGRIDAGSGLDAVTVRYTDAVVTLGGAPDVLTVYDAFVEVTDFRTGNSGDTLALGNHLQWYTNWTPAAGDPFASGYLRVLQQGADATVQFDADGVGHEAGWTDIVQLDDVNAAFLNAHNLDGFLV